jgi:hypothetical protein
MDVPKDTVINNSKYYHRRRMEGDKVEVMLVQMYFNIAYYIV